MHIRFKIGQLVKSKRLGVRGVIIEHDYPSYVSSGSDKSSNSLKNKPWYLLLMNNSNCTIYMPEDELLPDLNGKEIENPAIENYFATFQYGMYHVDANGITPLQKTIKNGFTMKIIK